MWFSLSPDIALLLLEDQPSQNVPAAGDFSAYNKISATYFPLKFIDNKDEVSTTCLLLKSCCLLLQNILTGLEDSIRYRGSYLWGEMRKDLSCKPRLQSFKSAIYTMNITNVLDCS